MNKLNLDVDFTIKISFIMLILMSSNPVIAQVIGEVVRSENMQDYPVGTKINEQTEIQTGSNQRIAIKTVDGGVMVAGNNAKIKIVKPGFFSHLFGKIYYFFKKEKREQVTIQTPTATIGIRGTKFIIDSEDNTDSEKVSLVEGQLNFDAKDDQYFELYEQRELNEFELFKLEQQAEFNEYKEQIMEEFVAFKKSIELDQGNALVFDGNKVTQTPLDDSVFEEITEFEQFLNDNSWQ